MAKLRIYFATNRNYLSDEKLFGGHFNPDGIAALRFGWAEFDPAEPKALPNVHVYPDPKPKVAGEPVANPGSKLFLDDLRVTMRDGCTDTIVFIHGFNVSFSDALKAGYALASEITIGGK